MKLNICTFCLLFLFFYLVQDSFGAEKGWLNRDVEVFDSKNERAAFLMFGSPVVDGKIYGWIEQGDNHIYSQDKAVTYGTFSNSVFIKPTGKTFSDMKEVYVSFNINEKFVSPSLLDSLAKYDDMYYAVCASCHAAIKHERFSVEQWGGIMDTMKKHANLSDKDAKELYRYVQLMLNKEP